MERVSIDQSLGFQPRRGFWALVIGTLLDLDARHRAQIRVSQLSPELLDDIGWPRD